MKQTVNSHLSDNIISVDELNNSLENLRLFDCRFALTDSRQGEAEYLQGHIPSAYYLHLEQHLSAPAHSLPGHTGGRHPLPATLSLQQKLRACGVDNDTPVVVYDNSRFAFAARAWWVLRYAGLKNVRILDGGFAAWQKAGLGVTDNIPAPGNGHFRATPEFERICDFDALHVALERGEINLVDSREQRRYAGIDEPIDPIAGHIPGALNFPWQEISDERGFLRDADFHQQRWQELSSQRQTIVYCGSGVTACVNLLSMQLAGVDALLYPGSWSDWISRRGVAIAKSEDSDVA